MRIPKSFVVPSIGVLALRVPTLPSANIEEPKQEYLKQLLAHFINTDASIYVHEWGHILQCVYYPYLFLRATRELRIIDKIILDLKRSDVPLRALQLREDVLESFHLDSTDFRFTEAASDGFVLAPTGEKRGPQDISEIDLLEEANSIFESRTISGNYAGAADYERWLRTGAKYTRTYKMLARKFGSTFAYNMLPPLVAAAYHTTYPVTAFASLLTSDADDIDVYQDLGASVIESILTSRLSRAVPPLGTEKKKLFRLPTEDEFAFLGKDTMVVLVQQSQQYPLYLLAESVWLHQSEPTRDWLYQPYDFIKNRGHRVHSQIAHLQPPLALYFFEDEPVLRGGALGTVSEYYQKHPVPSWWGDDASDTSWQNIMEVLYFRRVFVQNLTAGMPSAGERFCPHADCPLHDSGLCDGFFILPKTFSECHFPIYMHRTLGRTYDPQHANLRRSTS